jgi:ATP-dependent Clp endopeptidase proteolytic subunit ClpP
MIVEAMTLCRLGSDGDICEVFLRTKYEINQLFKDRKTTDLFRVEPVVVRVNKFNEDAAKKFEEEFDKAHQTGQPIIPVVIDSYGGQVYSLMAMLDTMRSAELPVATIAMGKAMSCGSALLAFGEVGMRYAAPNCTVLIHDVSNWTHGKVEEIKSSADETERLNQLLFTEMARHSGQPKKYFLDLIHEKGHADWYMTAKEAKTHKLVDYVRVPSFRISADIKMVLK